MTVTLPAIYGRADWTDYVDYWRDADVTWMQDRLIVRYATIAARDADLGAATAGQTTYVADADRLEFNSAAGNWIGVLGAQNIEIAPVNNTGVAGAENESVTISHVESTGGKGLVIGKDLTSVSTNTDLNSVLKVTGTGGSGYTTIKTGATTAKFTTNATSLVIDKPISAPEITVVGNINGSDVSGTTANFDSITALSLTVSSVSTLEHVTADTGALGGISFPGSGLLIANSYISDHGRFYGGSTSAIMRYNDGAGDGPSYFQVGETNIHLVAAGEFTIEGQTKIFERKGIIYYPDTSYSAATTPLGYGGPVVYSTTSLTAANYPPGTIWVS